MDSSSLYLDTSLSMLLKKRYFRLNESLKREIPLDSADDMEELVQIAESVNLDDCFRWIENVFFKEFTEEN